MTSKEAIEEKRLSKCRKTKILICVTGLDPCRVQASFHAQSVTLEWAVTAFSETVASTECTRNAEGSSAWQRTLITDVHSARELHTAWTVDHRGKSKSKPIQLEVVASSCYLGDMLSAADGCELSITTRMKTAWKKFKELLPVLSSRNLSFKTLGHMDRCCVQSAMLHANETWPLIKPNLQHLQQNNRAMIRQIFKVKPQDIVTTKSN